MLRLVVKGFVLALMASGLAGLSRFLMVPLVPLVFLGTWGLACVLFSYEWSGARRRYRQGIEEKRFQERAWVLAGFLLLIVTFIYIFLSL